MAFEVIEGLLPAQAAAGATVVTELGAVPSTFSANGAIVSKLSLVAPSLVTGVTTNTVTFNFRKVSGGVTSVLGTLTLNTGVNLAAETEVNVPITISTLADGDVLDVQMVQAGLGLVVPAGVNAKVELISE